MTRSALLHKSAAIGGAVLLFSLTSIASAKTTIDISNNGEGSRTSVEVKQSTGGSYYKSTNTSNVSTDIEVNSNGTKVETHDSTGTQTITEGPSGSNTSVKVYQTGDAKPTIIIEKGSATIKREVNDSSEEKEQTIKEAKEKAATLREESEKKKEELEEKRESLLGKLFNMKIINVKISEDLKSGNIMSAVIHIFTDTKSN